MGGPEGFSSFRCCNHAGEAQARSALFLEKSDHFDSASTGGQHGIEDDRVGVRKINGSIRVVDLRLKGFVVSAQSDVGHNGLGKEFEKTLCQAEAGPQDWNDYEGTDEASAFCVLEGRLDGSGDGIQLGSDLRNHQAGDIVEKEPEFLTVAILVAQTCHSIGNERVVEDGHEVESGRGLLLRAENIPECWLGDSEAACALFHVTAALLEDASAKLRPEPFEQALLLLRTQ